MLYPGSFMATVRAFPDAPSLLPAIGAGLVTENGRTVLKNGRTA